MVPRLDTLTPVIAVMVETMCPGLGPGEGWTVVDMKRNWKTMHSLIHAYELAHVCFGARFRRSGIRIVSASLRSAAIRAGARRVRLASKANLTAAFERRDGDVTIV